MDDIDQTSEVQSPLQRAMVIAPVACLFSLMFCYWISQGVFKMPPVLWAKLLAYFLLPIAVTFTILYRSSWHREFKRAARAILLLLFSCATLVGVVMASGVMLCIGWLLLNALSGGNIH